MTSGVVAIPDSGEGKVLHLNFHGRIIEHLGIQMYQSPTAAIAELVSNAWDADAENVWLTIPETRSASAEVVVKDDGFGMTFEDCEKRFLRVGYNRRKTPGVQEKTDKDRQVLGRKGIGKFAGFGICTTMEIDTVSKVDGMRTRFVLDLDDLLSDEYDSSRKNIQVLAHDNAKGADHGTTITLRKLTLKKWFSSPQIATGLARRFLLRTLLHGFQIHLNGDPLPEEDAPADTQFRFPAELTSDEWGGELPEKDDGWAREILNGNVVKWQVFFTKDPVEQEDLRGVAVYANGKLVQSPFFFNIVGGMQAQHGKEYLVGKVWADFLDLMPEDVVSPERQRVKWDASEATVELETWGAALVRKLVKLWGVRRAKDKMDKLEERLGPFSTRLERLQPSERNLIRSALKKLAGVATLNDDQFKDLGSALFTAFESGRLKNLVTELDRKDEWTANDFLKILVEADVLSALNVAESIKVKLQAVRKLRQMVTDKRWENHIRDHIAEHPWLLDPRWETYVKERNVMQILRDSATEAGMDAPEKPHEPVAPDADAAKAGRKRIDLALSSPPNLIVVEFMQPGKTLDWDHVGRTEQYISIVKATLAENTGLGFRAEEVRGLVVADRLSNAKGMPQRLQGMLNNGITALTWEQLLNRAEAEWQEYLAILVERAPDERLKELGKSEGEEAGPETRGESGA
jgi:hypothetical protein